jgi:hypothetical protein
MLPDTSAPAAETLPSVTVSVDRVDGSQAPALVTIVTFQSPSYGVWAVAGAAGRPAAAARAERNNMLRMRSWRMNQIPDLCDDAWLIQRQCVQNLLRRDNTKSSQQIKYLIGTLVPDWEQQFRGGRFPGALKIPPSPVPVNSYSETLGACVANCSSWGFAGRLLKVLA